MESVPGFVRCSRAWNAHVSLGTCAERVWIAKFRGTQRSSRGEITIEWAAHGDGPELRVRQGGFDLLTKDFSGLLRHLARIEGPISPDEFCSLLVRLGYSDMTLSERPANVVSFGRPG